MPQGLSHLNQLPIEMSLEKKGTVGFRQENGSPAQPQEPVSAGPPSYGLAESRTVRASIV